MDESGGNYADETTEMLSENAANPSTELRKRRSTRIVQAVPLGVTGVDALGRPFVERTSSLIINCHGCRYQSKHYVLKNMWVTLEIPHPETGQPPRTVRAESRGFNGRELCDSFFRSRWSWKFPEMLGVSHSRPMIGLRSPT